MKVCMLVHQNYYQDERVRRYVTALVENGDEVDVICPRHPENEHMAVSNSVQVVTIPLQHKSRAGSAALLLEYLLAFIFYFFLISSRSLFHRYDVIHVHNMPDILVFAAMLPRIFGVKIILDIHDPMPEFYQTKFGAGANALPIRLIRFEEKISIAFSHSVIAANDNFRDNLIERGVPSEKILTIRNFPDQNMFDPTRFKKTETRGEFIAIYPGTIAPRYGLDVAIRGLALLKDELPQVNIWIIGPETDHKQDLREMAASLGISERVRFFPRVISDEVPALMAQANIGIYPAIPDAHMDIAIPTKVLEFAVMGLPVIASSLTVIRQLFPEELIYLFEPGDAAGFASQLRHAELDENERQAKLAGIAEKILPVWNWQLEQQKYIDLLQNLTKNE